MEFKNFFKIQKLRKKGQKEMKKILSICFLAIATLAIGATAPTKFRYGIETKYAKFDSATELPISSGAITVTQSIHTVDGESDLSDDLATINGYATVNSITLYPANSARDITIKHGTGNILTADGIDYVIPDNGLAILVYDGTNWRLNPAGKINVPTSVTDRAVPVWNGTSGVALVDSGVTVDSGQNLATVNSLQFDSSPVVPSYSEGLVYYDTNRHTLNYLNEISGIIRRVGEQLAIPCYNDTGSTILKGKAVYLSGSYNGFPTVALAQANAKATCISTIGLIETDIANGAYGYVIRSGPLGGLDTSSYSATGAILYLSADTAGELTETVVSSPNWIIRLGNTGTINATTGGIGVNVSIGTNLGDTVKFYNGMIIEDTTMVASSDGSDITVTLEKVGGGDLSVLFSGAVQTFDCTPTASVTLMAGSDTIPVENWVYILASTNTLTVNQTGFPTTVEFSPIARVICQTAATAQTNGLLSVMKCANHLSHADSGMGELYYLGDWIRAQYAKWQSGVDYTFTPVAGSSTSTTIDLATTSGVIIPSHRRTFPAHDTSTGSNIEIINEPSTPYLSMTGIVRSSLTQDTQNVSLSNRYYNLVLWGVISEETADCHLFVNLPSGSYGSDSDAEEDGSSYTNTEIPQAYAHTGFLICQMRLKDKAAGGTLQLIATTNLRGKTPGGIGGGGSGGSSFSGVISDALLKIFNNTDNTKIGTFDLSTVDTGATRNISWPNKTGAMATDNSVTDFTYKTFNADGTGNSISNIENADIKAAAGIDCAKIGEGTTSDTELSYISTTTGNVQDALDGKQATITGGATTITGSDLAANYALKSDASGKVAVSTVTATQLGYVDATSSIQTQLNGKAASGANSDIASTTALTSISNAGDITIASTGAGINLNTHTDAGDDLAVNTDMLVVEGDTGRIGVATITPRYDIDIIDSSVDSYSIYVDSTYSAYMALDSTSSYYSGLKLLDTGSQKWGIYCNNGAGNQLQFDSASTTAALVIEQDGNVGIGTSSPDERLHNYIASGVITTRTESASLASGQESKFVARGSSRDAEIGAVYYDQSGAGGSDAAMGYIYMQQGDGDSSYYWTDNSGNLMTSGTATLRGSTSGTVVGTQTSDIRLKKDIKSIPYGLSEILQLEPIEFKYKSGGSDRLGFSAQQVENIIPEVVYNTKDFVATEDGENIEVQKKEEKDKDGKVTKEAVIKKGELSKRAMRYAEIVPVLVKAMQEQQAQIEALEKRIEKLEK